MKEQSIKERILDFITYLKIEKSVFERNCNLSNGFVDKIGKNIRRSSTDRISKIYPELNIDWLQTGKGKMLLKNNVTVSGDQNMTANHGWNFSGGINLPALSEHGTQKLLSQEGVEVTLESWPSERAQLLNRIAQLESENRMLNDRLKEKDDTIASKVETISSKDETIRALREQIDTLKAKK